jgi:hypothetical protein
MRNQFNAQFPNRNKASDGTIGDAAHAARESDHNPWIQDAGTGVVSALDITHDPGNGVDTHHVAEYLRQKRDPRIKYVISNRRIFNSSDWGWRTYTGPNPHISHMHASVKSEKKHYDDAAPWDLFSGQKPTLRKADKGSYVRELQTRLGIRADGAFGAQTEAAVKGFQRSCGLYPDGMVGPRIWAALDDLGDRRPSSGL